MLIIATDEAGYGPKLGPLVIAASVWNWDADSPTDVTEGLVAAFHPLTLPSVIGAHQVRVDDSKAVFKSGSGLASLHAVVSACHHWCGNDFHDVTAMFQHVASEDFDDITATAWLSEIAKHDLTSRQQTEDAIASWTSTGIELVDLRVRVINANRFNHHCESGLNKADLLSQSTLNLVRNAVQSSDQQQVQIFCDRHGGRRYYAGVIQHTFPDGIVSVISETKTESVYQCDLGSRTMRIAFTVKGDRFPPVALSSMHAKYLRERLMESFNAYFLTRHQEKSLLKPTAGYPVDADRFLQQIKPIIEREKIDLNDLVRQR